MCFDEIIKNVGEKADLVQKELVDPMEMYYKHYFQMNSDFVKQGNYFWNNLHTERTNMLYAKENYFTQMNTLTYM